MFRPETTKQEPDSEVSIKTIDSYLNNLRADYLISEHATADTKQLYVNYEREEKKISGLIRILNSKDGDLQLVLDFLYEEWSELTNMQSMISEERDDIVEALSKRGSAQEYSKPSGQSLSDKIAVLDEMIDFIEAEIKRRFDVQSKSGKIKR